MKDVSHSTGFGEEGAVIPSSLGRNNLIVAGPQNCNLHPMMLEAEHYIKLQLNLYCFRNRCDKIYLSSVPT